MDDDWNWIKSDSKSECGRTRVKMPEVEFSRTSLALRTHFEVFSFEPYKSWECPALGSRTALFFDWLKKKESNIKISWILAYA